MNCLIVDDNPLARMAVRNMVKQIDDLNLLGELDNATQAFNFIQKNNCDLLLLDIEMPGISGLDLIKTLEHKPLIILITSKTEYALEGYELQVVDYLLKPVAFSRLLKAISHARELYDMQHQRGKENSTKDFLFVRANNQMTRIDFEEILYVEAMGDYVIFHTDSKKYVVHLTMKGVQESLPEDRFVRVHRSYIAALDKIDNMVQNSLEINKHVIPVSETYKSILTKHMNTLSKQ
ncbi:MAG: response regulator transcription factor [Saprospiraceae bacterium]|nr:response regulator transcription factor [Saprospiraceae bacterium]